MSRSTLRRDVYAEAGGAIRALGFRKVAGRPLFMKGLSGEVEGVLELTDSWRSDELAVSLGFGLVFNQVEHLIADWCNDPPGQRFTIFGNVGYLKPQRGWLDIRFTEDRPIDEGVRQIIDLVTSEAVPFLEAHTSLQATAALMESGKLPLLEKKVRERLPVVYALSGDEDRAAAAIAVIEDTLASGEVDGSTFRRQAYVNGFRSAFPAIK
jgi:hypothetical protein